jgi:hypothetical protein
MRDQLVSFKTAKIIKELKFLEPVHYYYDFIGDIGSSAIKTNWNHSTESLYSAPSQSLLQKWIRENHKIHIELFCNFSGWGWILTKTNGTTIRDMNSGIFFISYEFALEDGLMEALKLINS